MPYLRDTGHLPVGEPGRSSIRRRVMSNVTPKGIPATRTPTTSRYGFPFLARWPSFASGSSVAFGFSSLALPVSAGSSPLAQRP